MILSILPAAMALLVAQTRVRERVGRPRHRAVVDQGRAIAVPRLHWEDFAPGQVTACGSRRVTRAEIVAFAACMAHWQDIGGARFSQATQNGLIDSMSYFSYPVAYGLGNVGRNTFDRQRFIDTQFSASKEWKIKEKRQFSNGGIPVFAILVSRK